MFRSSGSSVKKTKEMNEAQILAIFDSYADAEDPDCLNMDEISAFFEALGLDASSDVRTLVLLWRLGATSKPGVITRSEFLSGMKAIRRDSMESLIQLLPSLDPGFLERVDFREFFKFVFQFSREGTHKTIEKDVVCALLGLVLSPERAPHLEYFLAFLQQSPHTRITLDQWESFLQFQNTVPVTLSGYDDDGAWPLLLDEYVEWRRAQATAAK